MGPRNVDAEEDTGLLLEFVGPDGYLDANSDHAAR
jgi:hypothetical protein